MISWYFIKNGRFTGLPADRKTLSDHGLVIKRETGYARGMPRIYRKGGEEGLIVDLADGEMSESVRRLTS